MTSKQRSYLKGLAMNITPVFQIGKGGLSTEAVESYKEALEARELIKISILKNCAEDHDELARTIAQLTSSEVVQVIGNKIVLYKQAYEPEKRKIVLPK